MKIPDQTTPASGQHQKNICMKNDAKKMVMSLAIKGQVEGG